MNALTANLALQCLGQMVRRHRLRPTLLFASHQRLQHGQVVGQQQAQRRMEQDPLRRAAAVRPHRELVAHLLELPLDRPTPAVQFQNVVGRVRDLIQQAGQHQQRLVAGPFHRDLPAACAPARLLESVPVSSR